MRPAFLFLIAALASAQDPVSSLQSLAYDPATGYLPALLGALKIPIQSQIAVFSKTSIQSLRIEPSHPRLLYFNDSVIVGSVHGGFLELAAQDPVQGMQYYSLQQRPGEHPIHRQDCLNCHQSGATLIRSVIPTVDGIAIRESETPWGGWFVTGAHHLGNTVYENSVARELNPPASSDIVALSVFAHQMRMMNLLAHPDNIAAFVDHLLYLDETFSPIEGDSAFAKMFESQGPRDHLGRSLRQLDLQHRLMRYPCSYMIYTPAFDALPSATKAAIYRRMWTVLSGDLPSRLSPSDRQAIVEILRDTKPGLPGYFVCW